MQPSCSPLVNAISSRTKSAILLNLILPIKALFFLVPDKKNGGMKKRAGLARAIALDPRILFYDEPSAGLDPVTSAQIDQLIIDFTKKLNVTSVVVTHELDSAFTIADRMCMLDKGKVLKIGSRSEFEALRDSDPDQLTSEADKIIRQFLRGDPEGPITKRSLTNDYADDLLMVSLKSESKSTS